MKKMITQVYTTDLLFKNLLFKLTPRLTLVAIHTDQGMRVIAQSKTASFFVLNDHTDLPVVLEGDHFVSYMRLLGVEVIDVLFPKKSDRFKRLEI